MKESIPSIASVVSTYHIVDKESLSFQGLKLKKILSRHFATSYEKLVASSKILVANKHKLIIKNHINIKNVGLQMINKALILLFQQLLCHFKSNGS